MTAKEQLTNALTEARRAPFGDYIMRQAVGDDEIIDIFLAHPDLLLAVLAETGVLTEERHLDHPKFRYVSPWVLSGDQT